MLKNLRIEVDAHTHTVMSGHAWSTIQENCAAAAQKGMKALCMTDHGFCMKGTGTIWTPWSFSQLPDVIGGIRVYPGMEFNLWDTEGHLDEYLPGAFQHIRFGIASMHKNVMPVLDADAHTEAYIRAMDHACIDLIGHPGQADRDQQQLLRRPTGLRRQLPQNCAAVHAVRRSRLRGQRRALLRQRRRGAQSAGDAGFDRLPAGADRQFDLRAL